MTRDRRRQLLGRLLSELKALPGVYQDDAENIEWLLAREQAQQEAWADLMHQIESLPDEQRGADGEPNGFAVADWVDDKIRALGITPAAAPEDAS